MLLNFQPLPPDVFPTLWVVRLSRLPRGHACIPPNLPSFQSRFISLFGESRGMPLVMRIVFYIYIPVGLLEGSIIGLVVFRIAVVLVLMCCSPSSIYLYMRRATFCWVHSFYSFQILIHAAVSNAPTIEPDAIACTDRGFVASTVELGLDVRLGP